MRRHRGGGTRLCVLLCGGSSLVAQNAPAHRLVPELRISPTADDTSLFTQIQEVKVSPSGRIWVFDVQSSALFLFGPDGRLLRRIGRQGGGPGEFRGESGMTTLGDTAVAVWDPQNGRISFFDAAGAFRTSWATPTGFSTTDGLTSDRKGTLYLRRPIADPAGGAAIGPLGLVRLRPNGALGDSLAPPGVQPTRDVYTARRVQGQSRSVSTTSSRYVAKWYWSWSPDGFFVVADGGKYEITLARSTGRPLVIRRTPSPVAISEAEREEEHDRIVYAMQRTDPGWSWTGPPIPKTKAPLLDLFVSRDGRIWARIAVPSERIPEDELVQPRDPKAPVSHFRTPVAYDVFAPDGRYLGRVDFPARTALVQADGDLVWATIRDEDDLPGVARFRISPGLGK